MTTSHHPGTGKQIRIALRQAQFQLGEPILLEVVYVNRGNRPLSFREPARTWEVMLSVEAASGESNQVSFGRLMHYQSGELSRVSIEDAQQIELLPGGEHRFSEELWMRWPELWKPGRTTLHVTDQSHDAETLRSNALAIDISFTFASVGYLLALVRHPTTSEHGRIIASEWLSRLHPLDPFVAAPTGDQIARNAQTLDAWEHWWMQAREQPEVAAAIAAINHPKKQ
jgi:hypothetical protein